MTRTSIRAALAAAALLALGGCAELGANKEKPQAVTPQITEDVLRTRAQDSLAAGVKQYDAGDYENAEKSLQNSLDHGLLSKPDQSRARKILAFIYCTSNRESLCRAEFRKAFEINSDFALTPAEDGHPVWGPVYRDVRTQLIAEREAAATAAKPSASLGRAEQLLADGMVKYDAGEYPAARKLLDAALTEGLKDTPSRVKAMKFIAFTDCLERRYRECRAEFIKIYDVDAGFDLSPAEAGHPSWTKTFDSAKAAAKRAQASKGKDAKAPAPDKK
jgi:hypothetical protein